MGNCIETTDKVHPDDEASYYTEGEDVGEDDDEEEQFDRHNNPERILVNGMKLRFENDTYFVEQYQRQNLLGQGAHSKVFKCEHKKTGSRWAVKILEKRLLKSGMRKKYEQEISLLKKMDHPNIIQIHEIFQDNERIYIIMELCRGGELFQEINKRRKEGKRWTERQVSRILYQIFMALNYMHQNEYVHRDIKPENILFYSNRTDIIKIIDFGTCTKCNWKNGQKLNEFFGSPYYMAPEVLDGTYDYKCDIWSAGVIMFSMIMGRVPFDGLENSDIFEKTKKVSINFETKEFKKKSIECIDVLKKTLFKDPESRISAMEACAHKWMQTYAVEPEDRDDIKKALTNFRDYQYRGELQRACTEYIVNNLIQQRSLYKYRRTFFHLNKSASGVLSRIELIQAFWEYGFTDMTEYEMDRVLAIVDSDNSGQVSFEEFLMTCVHPHEMLTKDTMYRAFKDFDEDGGGSISAEEIISALTPQNGKISQETWNIVFNTKDGGKGGLDQEITFVEFKMFMERIFSLQGV